MKKLAARWPSCHSEGSFPFRVQRYDILKGCWPSLSVLLRETEKKQKTVTPTGITA